MIRDLELSDEFTSANLLNAFKKRIEGNRDLLFIYGENTITLNEIDSWSNGIAFQLRKSGICEGDFVAVYQPCNFALVATAIAFAKLGINVIYYRDTIRKELIQDHAAEGSFRCLVTSANTIHALKGDIGLINPNDFRQSSNTVECIFEAGGFFVEEFYSHDNGRTPEYLAFESSELFYDNKDELIENSVYFSLWQLILNETDIDVQALDKPFDLADFLKELMSKDFGMHT
ncbi:MAG: hypothetical protein IPO27_14345 [Bacteroidetes bacterium]|nr:hypothetical protein [Bacteroidota bacterium]